MSVLSTALHATRLAQQHPKPAQGFLSDTLALQPRSRSRCTPRSAVAFFQKKVNYYLYRRSRAISVLHRHTHGAP